MDTNSSAPDSRAAPDPVALPLSPAAGGWPPRNGQDLQEALRQAQANLLRYQELFDFAPDGYLVTDAQAVIGRANHAAAAMLVTRKEFLTGKPLLFFVGEGDRRPFTDKLYLLARQPETRLQWKLTLTPPRGGRLAVLVTAVSSAAPEQPPSIRWTLRDITRLEQAEQTLQAERDLADSLIEAAEAVIVLLGPAGRIKRANSYLRALTGHQLGELKGLPLVDLFLAEDRPSVRESLARLAAGAHKTRGAHRLLARDGRTRTVAWSARALYAGRELILVVGNDVTDLHEAQERALHAERLAAIGQMAAGLAHESRNALQRSQSCLAMLGFRLTDQPETLDLLARAQKAQDDLHRLFEDVRDFAAPVRLDLRHCDLAEVWRQAWEDLAHIHEGKTTTLAEDTAGMDLECMASPFHLQQVFRNLFDNALAASGAAPRVVVRARSADLDGREAIKVAIQDSGPGFAREDRQRAFEVFFTKKTHGTGLGLAICKRIIEAHGGRIALGESDQPGALILITLPRRPT
jgi:PAS domain S-box-containing protein